MYKPKREQAFLLLLRGAPLRVCVKSIKKKWGGEGRGGERGRGRGKG